MIEKMTAEERESYLATKALRILKFNRFLGAVLVPSAIWFLLNLFLPAAGILWWIIFFVLCMMGIQAFLVISTIVTVFLIMETVTIEDESELSTFTVSKTPNEILGRFHDVDFFEWLDLTDSEGVCRRATFVGTVDCSEAPPIPSGFLVIAPGLLYEFQVKDT